METKKRKREGISFVRVINKNSSVNHATLEHGTFLHHFLKVGVNLPGIRTIHMSLSTLTGYCSNHCGACLNASSVVAQYHVMLIFQCCQVIFVSCCYMFRGILSFIHASIVPFYSFESVIPMLVVLHDFI